MIYKIVLIKIDHRSQEAGLVQNVLTEFGCNIKVRLGLHEVSNQYCAQDGLVVLHVEGSSEDIGSLIDKLNNIDYVQAKLTEL
jgi:hypothetical protein